MIPAGLAEFVRRIWVRVTAVALVGLVLTLVVVVAAVYQLTIYNEHNDLDALLRREGTSVVQDISTDVAELAQTGAVISADDLKTIAGRALALHPGSSLHMTVVRFGEIVLTSARGPERLEALRDADQLPGVTPGVVRSQKGVRSRSQQIRFVDTELTVETIGDDQHIVDDARTIAGRVLLAAIIGALVGTLGLALAVHRSTRSLRAVSVTVRRTRLDDLRARVPENGGSSEVSVLARDVNAMLDELSEARAAREELIASVSHELRTPLAAARGHVDILREGRADDQTTSIGRIDRELTRMTRLVDDLLALSRASDPAWLSMRLVSARSVLDELASRTAATTTAHVVFTAAPDVMIEVDPDRLLQALSNLVQNAIIHTPDGTPVSVDIRINSSMLEFVVVDQGPGMPEHVLANLGEAFVRGSDTGTGLGLAVSRAVARAHHGTLTVDSDATGTTVKLSIPIESEPHL